MPEIPENSRKISRKCRMFFCTNATVQSENLWFLVLGKHINPGKFRGNFRRISQLTKMCEKLPQENLRENSRKIQDVFLCKCTFTERKSVFLLF